MQNIFEKQISIIDAKNAVLGRLASTIAKRLLNGETIVIVNAEQSLISGNERFITEKYKNRIKKKTKSNPLKGPFYPRRSDLIFKRTVRGMLPYKNKRGKDAYERLYIYNSIPEPIKDKKFEQISDTQSFNPRSKIEYQKF